MELLFLMMFWLLFIRQKRIEITVRLKSCQRMK